MNPETVVPSLAELKEEAESNLAALNARVPVLSDPQHAIQRGAALMLRLIEHLESRDARFEPAEIDDVGP